MPSSSRDKWLTAIAALVAFGLLLAWMSWLRPGVPKDVVIIAGPEGDPTHAWAQRYAVYVRSHGLGAEVVETAGSGDVLGDVQLVDTKNARRTVGFLQSGAEQTLGDPSASAELQSLGSLYFEPIWVMVRNGLEIEDVADLAAKRVYWGRPGSEARTAAALLSSVYAVELNSTEELDAWTPAEASTALVEGRIDAGLFVGTSDTIRALLLDDQLRPLSAEHSDVFTRTHPEVGALHIPEGLFSLAKMVPRKDLVVMAPTMNLVAHEGLHPAIVDLLLSAATRFHSRATLLSEQGEFPSSRYTSLPMNEDAVSFFKQGPRGLRKYLPFWLASLIDQLITIGLPFILVLSTVFKVIPVFFNWKLKIELSRYWKRLAEIEKKPKHDLDESLAELAAIETESTDMRVPRMHLPSYFELRQEIHDMRDRLKQGW